MDHLYDSYSSIETCLLCKDLFYWFRLRLIWGASNSVPLGQPPWNYGGPRSPLPRSCLKLQGYRHIHRPRLHEIRILLPPNRGIIFLMLILISRVDLFSGTKYRSLQAHNPLLYPDPHNPTTLRFIKEANSITDDRSPDQGRCQVEKLQWEPDGTLRVGYLWIFHVWGPPLRQVWEGRTCWDPDLKVSCKMSPGSAELNSRWQDRKGKTG